MKRIILSLFASLLFYIPQISAVNARIGLNFRPYDATNARGNLIFSPNNPTGDVGENQYIFSSYGALRSFNKFTGLSDGVLDIYGSTFAPASQGDVWIVYNRFAKRWFYTYELFDPVTGLADNLNFQVSNEATIKPSTEWAYYNLPSDQINPNGGGLGSFIDFQQPAYDQNATYNSAGCFDTSGNFIGSSLTIIPTESFIAGNPNITVFPGLFPEIIGEVAEGFAAPANNFDTDPTYGYYVSVLFDQPDGIIGNKIGLYRILDAGSNNPTLGTSSPVIITLPFSFAFNSLNASHKGNLLGAFGLLQVQINPITPHVRNHQLYYGQCVQVDSTGTASISGDRIGIQWYQFDLTGDPTGKGLGQEQPDTVPVLIQNGILFDDSPDNALFYNMPSLMTNKQGDMILSFCSSGNNAYVNAGYAFREASDAPGSLREPLYVTNSSFPQNYNANISLNPGPNVQRWGDQSSAVTDPDNDLDFWLTQSFSALQNAWGMQATQVLSA